jgi:hypothetical protein
MNKDLSVEDSNWIDFCHLEELPIELQVNILCQLADVSSLLSAIQASRSLLYAYHGCSKKILFAIFLNVRNNELSNTCAVMAQQISHGLFTTIVKAQAVNTRSMSKRNQILLYQLYLAIRRKIISRDDDKAPFDSAWHIAKHHGLTRLLKPYGIALAYTLEDHDDKKTLLQKNL